MNKLLLTLVIPCLLSCNTFNKRKHADTNALNKEEKQFYELDIRKSLSNIKEVKLSSLVKDIRYIPLETTPECLLSKIRKIELFNNYIFLIDKKGLYQFDFNGKFIRQVGSFGPGPGEYGIALNFSIIRNSGEIILYAYPSGSIIVYDLKSGLYKRSFRLRFDIGDLVEFPFGKITFLTPNEPITERLYTNNEIYVCDSMGRVLDSIPDSRPGIQGNITSLVRSYIRKEELYYMDCFQDSLSILSQHLKKRTYVNFRMDNKIKGNEIHLKKLIGKVQFPDFLSIDKFLESEKNFFISIQCGIGLYVDEDIINLLYDKTTGELFSTPNISNDIDRGMPFWPEYIFDNIMIEYYQPFQILEQYESNMGKVKYSDDFINLVKSIKINDNPVLMICDIK